MNIYFKTLAVSVLCFVPLYGAPYVTFVNRADSPARVSFFYGGPKADIKVNYAVDEALAIPSVKMNAPLSKIVLKVSGTSTERVFDQEEKNKLVRGDLVLQVRDLTKGLQIRLVDVQQQNAEAQQEVSAPQEVRQINKQPEQVAEVVAIPDAPPLEEQVQAQPQPQQQLEQKTAAQTGLENSTTADVSVDELNGNQLREELARLNQKKANSTITLLEEIRLKKIRQKNTGQQATNMIPQAQQPQLMMSERQQLQTKINVLQDKQKKTALSVAEQRDLGIYKKRLSLLSDEEEYDSPSQETDDF